MQTNKNADNVKMIRIFKHRVFTSRISSDVQKSSLMFSGKNQREDGALAKSIRSKFISSLYQQLSLDGYGGFLKRIVDNPTSRARIHESFHDSLERRS